MSTPPPVERNTAKPMRLRGTNRHAWPDPAHPGGQFGNAPVAEPSSGILPDRAKPDEAESKANRAPAACAGCQTEIPATETLCAICMRTRGHVSTGWRTLVHWLILLAILLVLLGLGHWLGQ
ncbi:hypothetical protein C9E81_05805 [Paracoccus alkanivorans]|uniref:Uncharacterized protein n=1 Tax=Paracoccus alkanivorans TaxID=2116655 RepID=A0A3M0MEN3_9RHOB|nr:hypothetical protein C9E81_05805 [Paracoccus alkanivorans]